MHHGALLDHRHDITGVGALQELDVVALAGVQHRLAYPRHLRTTLGLALRRGPGCVGAARRHAGQTIKPIGMVARAIFGHGDARHTDRLVDMLVGDGVLDLDAEDQFAALVERPQICLGAIFRPAHAPDLRRETGAGATQAAPRQFGRGIVEEGITAAFLRQHLNRARVAGVADVNAMDAGIEELGHHPGVGASVILVQADDAGGDEDARRGVTAAGGTGILEAPHEFTQLREVHRAMLEIHRDGVGIGLGHLDALGIGIDARTDAGAGVVHRLIVLPQLDHLVEAARLVVEIDAGRLDAGEDRRRAATSAARRAASTAWRRAASGGRRILGHHRTGRGQAADHPKTGREKFPLLHVHVCPPVVSAGLGHTRPAPWRKDCHRSDGLELAKRCRCCNAAHANETDVPVKNPVRLRALAGRIPPRACAWPAGPAHH